MELGRRSPSDTLKTQTWPVPQSLSVDQTSVQDLRGLMADMEYNNGIKYS